MMRATTLVAGVATALPMVGAVKLARDSDACKCLSYNHVYKSGLAECGEGHEGLQNRLSCGQYRNETCGHALCRLSDGAPYAWFLIQNHSLCMRKMQSAWGDVEEDKVRWCWVSSACQELNGGKVVNQNVSTRMCTSADAAYGDLSPPELMAVSPFDPIYTYRFAYDYEDVESFDGKPEPLDYDEMVGQPSKFYTSGCKVGTSTRHNEEDEMSINILCDQGKTKYFVDTSDIKCVRGCPNGTKFGPTARADGGGYYPRKEAWMYGAQGPQPSDRLDQQNDENSYALTD